jgi:hypothetical protein
MRSRLTPPTFPVFIISLILAILAIACSYANIPVIGHYILAHKFWVMAAAYAVLLIGVVFRGL